MSAKERAEIERLRTVLRETVTPPWPAELVKEKALADDAADIFRHQLDRSDWLKPRVQRWMARYRETRQQ